MLTLADAVAAPAIVRFGIRRCLLSPLTLEDLGIFDRLCGTGHALSRSDITALLWLSMRHNYSSLTLGRVWWLTLSPWARSRALQAIADLNPAIIETKTPEPRLSTDEPEEPPDFTSILHAMIIQAGALPTAWRHMTMLQVEAVMSCHVGDSEAPATFDTLAEAQAYAALRDKRAADRRAGHAV